MRAVNVPNVPRPFAVVVSLSCFWDDAMPFVSRSCHQSRDRAFWRSVPPPTGRVWGHFLSGTLPTERPVARRQTVGAITWSNKANPFTRPSYIAEKGEVITGRRSRALGVTVTTTRPTGAGGGGRWEGASSDRKQTEPVSMVTKPLIALG